MKRIPLIILLLITGSLYFVSCNPDEEDSGTTDPREKFTGNWTVQEVKKKLTYDVQITNDPSNSAQVLLNGFHNCGVQPYAIVTSSTITLPVQSFSSVGLTFNGSGTYSDNKINWIYYVNDGADLDTIEAVYTRKN